MDENRRSAREEACIKLLRFLIEESAIPNECFKSRAVQVITTHNWQIFEFFILFPFSFFFKNCQKSSEPRESPKNIIWKRELVQPECQPSKAARKLESSPKLEYSKWWKFNKFNFLIENHYFFHFGVPQRSIVGTYTSVRKQLDFIIEFAGYRTKQPSIKQLTALPLISQKTVFKRAVLSCF